MIRDESLELLRQHPSDRNPIRPCLSVKDNILTVLTGEGCHNPL